MGKYSPLDFETVEPLNPLDGLLTKTKYGGEVVVGKTFFMSWLTAWQNWLNFDNHRGVGGASQQNRATIESFVGVVMMSGSSASWTDNPLNMVNFYGYGRMAWDPTVTTKQAYREWIAKTFGANFPQAAAADLTEMLVISEQAATELALYHGYRGIWCVALRESARGHRWVASHSLDAGAARLRPLVAVMCCSRFLLTRALLMTSSHSKVRVRARRQLSIAKQRAPDP